MCVGACIFMSVCVCWGEGEDTENGGRLSDVNGQEQHFSPW